MLDTRSDGRAHIHHTLFRGPSKMHVLILDLTMLGLPMHALLLSVRTRLVPAVAFGVELVVIFRSARSNSAPCRHRG